MANQRVDTESPNTQDGTAGATAPKKRDRRLHRSTVWLAAIAFTVCAFAFTFSFTHAWGRSVDRLEEMASTDAFATMDLETLYGERFTFNNLKGAKLTLFNVWGTSCSPCISEMPDLEALNHSYPEGTIQVVGIVSNATDANCNVIPKAVEDAKAICIRAGVTYPSLIMDAPMRAFINTNIVGTPTTFIVNQNGEILRTLTGGQSLMNLQKIIDETLAKLD